MKLITEQLADAANQQMVTYAKSVFAGHDSLWFGFIDPDGNCISEKYLIGIDQIIYGFECVYGVHAHANAMFSGIGFYVEENDINCIDKIELPEKELLHMHKYDYKFVGYANLIEVPEK